QDRIALLPKAQWMQAWLAPRYRSHRPRKQPQARGHRGVRSRARSATREDTAHHSSGKRSPGYACLLRACLRVSAPPRQRSPPLLLHSESDTIASINAMRLTALSFVLTALFASTGALAQGSSDDYARAERVLKGSLADLVVDGTVTPNWIP